MKKITKILAIIAILIICVLSLTGCGNQKESTQKSKNNEANSNNTNNNLNTTYNTSNSTSNSTTSNETTDTRTIPEVDKKVVDYKTDEPYYFIIGGITYKAGDKISDLSKSGLHLNQTGAEKEISKYGYLIGGGAILNESKKTVFNITPFNGGTETIKGAEAQIGSLSIDSSTLKYFPDIEVCNHITIGTAIEDVIQVFGEPTSKTDATEYYGPTYKYDVTGDYKYYIFDTDKDGKVTSIKWENYVTK